MITCETARNFKYQCPNRKSHIDYANYAIDDNIDIKYNNIGISIEFNFSGIMIVFFISSDVKML